MSGILTSLGASLGLLSISTKTADDTTAKTIEVSTAAPPSPHPSALPVPNHQQWYSVDMLRSFSELKPMRVGSSNLWCKRKALNQESALFALDIAPQINTSDNKGYEIIKYEVVYAVSGAALTSAPTDNLSITQFTNNAAPTLTRLAFSGASFPTAISSPGTTYVVTRSLSAPVYVTPVTPPNKLSLELTFPCDQSTALDIYGIMIHYVSSN